MDEEMATLLTTGMTCDYNHRSGRWRIYDKFSKVVAIGKAETWGEARGDIVIILECIKVAKRRKKNAATTLPPTQPKPKRAPSP